MDDVFSFEEFNRLLEEFCCALLETGVGDNNNVDSLILHAYLEMAIDDLSDDEVMAMLASIDDDDDGPKLNSASQDSIEKLEKVKIEELESDLDCAICLDQFFGTTTKRLPCSHIFHGDCIAKWLRNSNMCPLCRYQMPAAAAAAATS